MDTTAGGSPIEPHLGAEGETYLFRPRGYQYPTPRQKSQRQHMVSVMPPGTEVARHSGHILGDVWYSKGDRCWYFTWGAGNLKKKGEGYDTPGEAAEALLRDKLSAASNGVVQKLDALNTLRGCLGWGTCLVKYSDE